MPTYDYTCDACQHHWEEFHSMSAEPVKKCPTCGKKKARRLIGAGGGLIFKGTGFYITDYGKDGKGPRKATEGASTGSSDAAPKAEAPKPTSSKADAA